MSILDIFSKRNKKKNTSDLYTYDKLPDTFKAQVVHIWTDAIGKFDRNSYNYYRTRIESPSNKVWDIIEKLLCKEYGIFRLHKEGDDPFKRSIAFLQSATHEQVLDILELTCRCIDNYVREWSPQQKQMAGITQSEDNAIEELNDRFKEHGLGYQYMQGYIIRIDSQYLHNEVTTPAIQLLLDEDFEGASEEFFSAHKHYKEKRYKEAINDALKSFESTLRTICNRMGWKVEGTATAKALIKTCFDNELIPTSMESHINAVQSTLVSGLPTVRNKNAGHGQGENPVELPSSLVSYALHLAATNIMFVVECYKEKKK